MWSMFYMLGKLTSFLPNFIFKTFWRMLDIFDGRFGAVLRYILICGRLKKCGKKVYIGSSVYIESPNKLSLGNNVSLHHHCTIISSGEVDIGDNVAIAHASSIISTNHTWDDSQTPIKYNPVIFSKITICEDVWIGCGVRILAGSNIPSRSIIAAGAVVTKILTESGYIYGGIPAKKIKSL